MRLIDADELKRAFIGNRYGTKAIEYVIDDAPTVKALPIDWIDGYIKRRANDVNIYAEILFISDMVKEWEKENEK